MFTRTRNQVRTIFKSESVSDGSLLHIADSTYELAEIYPDILFDLK